MPSKRARLAWYTALVLLLTSCWHMLQNHIKEHFKDKWATKLDSNWSILAQSVINKTNNWSEDYRNNYIREMTSPLPGTLHLFYRPYDEVDSQVAALERGNKNCAHGGVRQSSDFVTPCL